MGLHIYVHPCFNPIALRKAKIAYTFGLSATELRIILSTKELFYKPGACNTKHLKPKIFLSAIQFVWHLRKS